MLSLFLCSMVWAILLSMLWLIINHLKQSQPWQFCPPSSRYYNIKSIHVVPLFSGVGDAVSHVKVGSSLEETDDNIPLRYNNHHTPLYMTHIFSKKKHYSFSLYMDSGHGTLTWKHAFREIFSMNIFWMQRYSVNIFLMQVKVLKFMNIFRRLRWQRYCTVE